ncbi:MAG: UDP-N-acetylglucosamine--N-acetylmuramyl-(pentapeptide) pyrophosphoryl-undecaprenol N-acetylglucosamine transferase [Microthrixaceae bacterium]
MSDRAGVPATYALIAGGGTAGHVLPAVAVARELVARGHEPSSLHFVASSRGRDGRTIEDAGFTSTLLPGRGIQRRLTAENLAAAWGLVRALGQAVALVRRRRPRVVLAVGGFASAAAALAAVLWRVPLVVAEQNARAGAANRLVARFAAATAVPFAETDLPRATVTGNPVRDDVLAAVDLDPVAARDALDLPADRRVLAAFAGSLGSRRINTAVWEAVAGPWRDRDDLAVHHVVGERDWPDLPEALAGGLDGPGSVTYHPVRYEDRMATLLAAADLAVCRAGGTTVAELAVLGVPAVLVPLPIATRDHQTANAGPLVRAGAAALVPDDRLDAVRLVAEVDPLLAGDTAGMAAAARALGHPGAAAAVADLVERAAERAA